MPARRADAAAAMSAARKLIEGPTLSQGEIAGRLEVPATTLSTWKKREGWRRPAGAPGFTVPVASRARNPKTRRRAMVARLYALFERQMADLEARANDTGQRYEERDARALGTLARTLGTLIALERDDDASANDPERLTPDDIRARLAQRLFGTHGGWEAAG